MMKTTLLSCLLLLSVSSFAQDSFTSRKGLKFFPGHIDIIVTVDSAVLRYELYNHWYVKSYAELRQVSISLDSLSYFNESNDTLRIELTDSYVKVFDKRFKLNRKVKQRHLCASPDVMRKISFAYEKSLTADGVSHYDLYKEEDLQLKEEEFKELVIANLKRITTR